MQNYEIPKKVERLQKSKALKEADKDFETKTMGLMQNIIMFQSETSDIIVRMCLV